MNLSEMRSAHLDAVNARNVAKGICLVHPGGEAPPRAAYVLTLPNGNAVPVCKDCHKWWMENPTGPEGVPVSVVAVTPVTRKSKTGAEVMVTLTTGLLAVVTIALIVAAIGGAS